MHILRSERNAFIQFVHSAATIAKVAIVAVIGLAGLALADARSSSAQGPRQNRPAAAQRHADSLLMAADYRGAVEAYSALIARDSSVAAYWFQLGMASAGARDYRLGVSAFARAAELGKSPASFYNTGAMYARLSRADSAFDWLNRAVTRGFADGHLLETDDDLASIRADTRFPKLLYAATHAPRPCADSPDRHRLDFWIGEWSVTTPGGAPAGQSSVQAVSGGCALLENWSDLRGGSGKSLNAFNPAVGQWQQYWIGQNGNPIEYRESEWSEGRVTYFSKSPATASSPASLGRLTFSRLDSTTVRQFSELSTDGGKTWQPQYDLHYHRRAP